MAKNQRYTHADHISLPVPEDTASGDPVRVGAIAGVAQTDRRADGTATVWLDGSYNLEVTGALTVGQPVYITGAGALTATAGTNYPFGVALVAKGSGAGIAEVAPFGHNPAVAVAAGA
jgi:predicted RecA/RadA family phage recombinase